MMKLPAMLLFLLMIQGLLFQVEAQQSRFDRANDMMNDQRIEEAVEVYKSIENDGYQSGKLYYNLGIAAIYRDSLGLARYYLLQSGEFPDSRQEAVQALEFVNEQLENRSAVLPELPWERLFNWLETTFGAYMLMGLAILFLNLAAGGIIGAWFTDKASSWLRYGAFSAGVLSLILIFFSIYLQHLEQRFDTAVMTERQSSSVYERPDTRSPSVSAAYEGYKMTVDRTRSGDAAGWYYVRLENGMYGWIESERVRTF